MHFSRIQSITMFGLLLATLVYAPGLCAQDKDGDPKPDEKAEAEAEVSGIDFQKNYEQTKAKAQAEEKRIMLVFGSRYCQPCQHHAESIWSNADVGESVNSRLVALKVDVDVRNEELEKFKVTVIPTVVLAEANGTMIGRFEGVVFFSTEEATTWFDKKLKAADEIKDLEDAWFDDGPAQVGIDLAAVQMELAQPANAVATLEIVADMLEEGDAKIPSVQVLIGEANYEQRKFKEAAANFKAAVDLLPKKGKEGWKARHMYGECLIYTEDARGAFNVLDPLFQEIKAENDTYLCEVAWAYGTSLGQTGDPAKARRVLIETADAFPDGKEVDQLRAVAAIIALQLGDIESAKKEAKEIIEAAGDAVTPAKMTAQNVLDMVADAEKEAEGEGEKPKGEGDK